MLGIFWFCPVHLSYRYPAPHLCLGRLLTVKVYSLLAKYIFPKAYYGTSVQYIQWEYVQCSAKMAKLHIRNSNSNLNTRSTFLRKKGRETPTCRFKHTFHLILKYEGIYLI